MILRGIGIEQIRARVANDFNISSSDWRNRSLEWVANAIREMGILIPFGKTSIDGKVEDYTCKLPCDAEVLRGISYNYMRLPRNDGMDRYDDKEDSFDITHPTQTYTLTNRDYICTTFKEGNIIFFYYILPLDGNGFPMIPDNAKVIKATCNYILLRHIGRGGKHPVFKDYEKLEYKVMGQTNPFSMFAQARNSVATPDADQLHMWGKILNSIIVDPEAYYQRFYSGTRVKVE